MKRALQGRYLRVATADEVFKAFVPSPLPPHPSVEWTPQLRARFDAALLALGRLDAVTDLLPNASLLLYSFVRKEAVLSSMIEGTRSSLADLMLFELDEQPGVPIEMRARSVVMLLRWSMGLSGCAGASRFRCACSAKCTMCC